MTDRLREPSVCAAPFVIVLMGVSGSGKTTVGKALAARLGWRFEDGDALHPALNIAKMHAGIALSDADRRPWLEAVAAWIDRQRAKSEPAIIACSALKRDYRRLIVGDRSAVRLVYLRGSAALIAQRLAARHGHFMPASLLRSQLETLEAPNEDERAVTIDIDPPVGRIVDQIMQRLALSPRDDIAERPTPP